MEEEQVGRKHDECERGLDNENGPHSWSLASSITVSSQNSESNRSSRRRRSICLSRDMSERLHNSISLTRYMAEQLIDDSMAARAGDAGDRVLEEENKVNNEKQGIFVDIVENTEDIKVPDALHLLSKRHQPQNMSFLSTVSPVPQEIISPPSTVAILNSIEKDQLQTPIKDKNRLPQHLDHMYYLLHLAVFGILGVFTRYLLQKLFGPGLLAFTGDHTPLYLDLPSNILGSFLMGWFGIVFKPNISNLSNHLAVGLTTGYLGSLTTFSGWNQKMLDLASEGHWVFSIGGIILGMIIVNESIAIGVESAGGAHRLLIHDSGGTRCSLDRWRVNNHRRHLAVAAALFLILGSLLGLSIALFRTDMNQVIDGAIIWLACLVAIPGVWIRWYLARLNGQGLGRKKWLKWLPIGTLSTNVLAACLMAAVSTVNKAVGTRRCYIIVSGIQLGFLGCLSTVSTFVAEVFIMRQSNHPGRGHAYAAITIILSFSLGTMIYSVPVWIKHYK